MSDFSSRPSNSKPNHDSGPSSAVFRLIVRQPAREAKAYTLELGRVYTIGRRASSDIRLDSTSISSDHAVLYCDDPPQIMDVGSRNGTIVDGQRLTPGTRQPLRHRSVILISGVSLVLRRSQPKPLESGERPLRKVSQQTLPPPGSESVRVQTQSYVVRDARMRELYAFVKRVAASDVSTLILGETGVGKELLAHAIHENSPRRSQPFITLNCPAIPETLVESELFGYERGAFSGAVSAKPGLFEAAHGGTLFLDEVGELSRFVQAKLLRVLETLEVMRLGSVRPRRVDVRIVAATNRDLRTEVAKQNFRADLFYRLNGMTVNVPPLRERPDDIVALAQFFIERSMPVTPPVLTEEALAALRSHVWHGNARELRSVMERAVLLADAGVIDVQHLSFNPPPEVTSPPAARPSVPASPHVAPSTTKGSESELGNTEESTGIITAKYREELARRERRRTEAALEQVGGNQKDAAKLLGISRRTLINRLERHGIIRPRKRRDDPDDS
jgi:transcriptional regulator with PAS, ATPase and Fis domain